MTFPKKRLLACKNADGTQLYKVWDWSGKSTRIFWFGTEQIQIDECTSDEFDIRELPNYSLGHCPTPMQVRKLLESCTDADIQQAIPVFD